MLRSFRVENHKSFRDEAELLLVPAYDKSRPVVPVAAVLGANASGKSNLLDALRWLQVAVRESYARWEPGAGVPRTPFRLDPAAAASPSLYCIEIAIDGARYTYGLEANDERITEEWLYTYPHTRRRVIFERDADGVRLGSTVADHRARGEQLARQTRKNALFLSVAAHNDLIEALPIYEWFRTGVGFVHGDDAAGEELLDRLSDEYEREPLVALIAAADLGISDVSIGLSVEPGTPESRLLSLFDPDEGPVLTAEESRGASRSVEPEADPVSALNALLSRLRSSAGLRFHHGEYGATLALEDQSAGTRSWIGLVSAALSALNEGGLMVVDEVGASLHPHLTARLINLFRDADSNPGSAQLLLTTHDATLLDEDTLARDEIWFVEKAPDSGATRLYPLTDFHPRKNENTEGRYLAGGYGGVPILADYRFRRALRAGTRDAAA